MAGWFTDLWIGEPSERCCSSSDRHVGVVAIGQAKHDVELRVTLVDELGLAMANRSILAAVEERSHTASGEA